MHVLYAYDMQPHQLALVGVATLICCLGAGSGLALGREALRAQDHRARVAWGAAGVAATGLLLCAAHLVATIAADPGIALRLDPGRAVLSFLVALTLAAAGTACLRLARHPLGRAAGGAVVGMALPVLHVLGVRAATVEPDPGGIEPGGWVTAVVVVALVANTALLVVGASFAAAWLSFRARRQLRSEERHLQDLAEVSVDGLLLCEGETIVGVNQGFERMLERGSGEFVGRGIGDVLPASGTIPLGREVDAHLDCPRAGRIPVRVLAQDVAVGNRRLRLLVVRDQRERLRSEARMLLLAHHDPLTGLANRRNFTETLAARLLLPSSEDAFALIMLDLDRFKEVNDTFGHGMGDELLRRVAGRLRRAVRADDLVARLGGDEFAVIAGVGGNPTAVRRIATDFVDLIARPFLIDGQIIEIGASVGVALAPADGDEPAQLARNADLALYSAKRAGRGVHRLFEPEMNTQAQARRTLELDLRRATAQREFEVHYQPQVDPRTGAFQGAEALVRWQHPQRGMVPPADFIPLAEEIGLIGSIGDWVLRTACAEATRWPEPLSVAVNVSPVQFRDPWLVATVAEILAETGLPAGRLELEVTETALMQDDGHTLATLHALRALGVRISMDDFGTGYSSLSYLRLFPFDKIKIDRSFIRQVPGDADSIAIVQAIATLGLKLKMTVTAEGVETTEQRRFTASEGCDQIQGYLISRPVPAGQMLELLAESTAAPAAA